MSSTPFKTNYILAFISVTGGLLTVASSFCPVLHHMSAASGTVAGEDILVSVALLSLKVVQINMILCMNTCIKLLVEFLTAACVIF